MENVITWVLIILVALFFVALGFAVWHFAKMFLEDIIEFLKQLIKFGK